MSNPIHAILEISDLPEHQATIHISLNGSAADILVEMQRLIGVYVGIKGAVLRPQVQADSTAEQKKLMHDLAKLLPST